MWYVFFTAVVSFRRIVFGESILPNRLRHRRSTFNYDRDTLFLVRPESEMLLPFVREIFKTLRSESGKAQPAIRIELCLHGLYVAILVFCLGAALLHALMPWVREGAEHLFEMGFITSLVVSCALAVVGVTLSLRLK
jgi:hypothetical protein